MIYPGSNPYKNRVFGAPAGEEATCDSLEVTVGKDARGLTCYASAWEPEEVDWRNLDRGMPLTACLWTITPTPLRVIVAAEPDFTLPEKVSGNFSRDEQGHSVFWAKYAVTREQVRQLREGERLWMVLWSERGLSPACMEAAAAPYFFRATVDV